MNGGRAIFGPTCASWLVRLVYFRENINLWGVREATDLSLVC